jgi:AAA domain
MTAEVHNEPIQDHTPAVSRFESPNPPAVKPKHQGDHATFRNQKPLETRTVEQILTESSASEAQRWLVADLIPSGTFTIVYGAPKCGKTTLLSHLCGAIIGGTAFLGRDVLSGEVLWLDLEQDRRLTGEVLAEAGAVGKSQHVHVFNGTAPDCDDVASTICALNPVAVVIDSLSRFLRLDDENSASETNRKLDPLIQIAHQTGTTILTVHHDTKREGTGGKNLRGSSALLAAADLAIEVRRDPAETTKRTLQTTSRYSGVPERLTIQLTDEGYALSPGNEYVQDTTLLSCLAKRALTAPELGAELGLTRPGVIGRIRRLEAGGRVTRRGSGKKGDPFVFALAPNSESASAATAPISISQLRKEANAIGLAQRTPRRAHDV